MHAFQHYQLCSHQRILVLVELLKKKSNQNRRTFWISHLIHWALDWKDFVLNEKVFLANFYSHSSYIKDLKEVMIKSYPKMGDLRITIFILRHIDLSSIESFRSITCFFDPQKIQKKIRVQRSIAECLYKWRWKVFQKKSNLIVITHQIKIFLTFSLP